MSVTFSFKYNSSFLRFGLILWQFHNRMFKPMKLIKGHLSWMTVYYSGLLGVFRLLGTALVELLGREVDCNIVSVFGMDLETELTLKLMNVKGLGGGQGQ